MNDNFNNRWVRLDLPKVYDDMVSPCGDETGRNLGLEVYKNYDQIFSVAQISGTSSKIHAGEVEDCQWQPVYKNPCNPIVRLDLASGTDLTIDVEITLGSEILPISFSEKYETTFTEIRESNSGRFQSQPQALAIAMEDGSTIINKFVGGVDFTDLHAAASLGKILPEKSYDLITCAHPDPAAGLMPNVAHVYQFLREGGEFRIAFYDFDYYSKVVKDMVKDIDAIFADVQKIQIIGDRYALRKPPMVSRNDFVISGIKRSTGEQMSSVSTRNEFKIYPNPAFHSISIGGLQHTGLVEIFNITGE